MRMKGKIKQPKGEIKTMKNLVKKTWKLAVALSVLASLATFCIKPSAIASPSEANLAHYMRAHNPIFDGVQVNGPWMNSAFTSQLTSVPAIDPYVGNAQIAIPVTASFEIISATAAMTLTTIPTFTTSYANVQTGATTLFETGSLLILTSSVTSAVTLQDNSLLSGTQLYLSSQTIILAGPGAPATNVAGVAPTRAIWEFRFDATRVPAGWVQIP